MNWVKNNLALVLGLGASILLMALSGKYVADNIERDRIAQSEVDDGIGRLNRLQNQDPHPGDEERGIDNISLVIEAQRQLREDVLESMRASFTTFETPAQLDLEGFQSLLEESIARMQWQARSSGTRLPSDETQADPAMRDLYAMGPVPGMGMPRTPAADSDYSFSFEEERVLLNLDERLLRPLAFQLVQVEALCGVLFDSKAHSIVTVRRPELSVPEEDDYDEGGAYGMGGADPYSLRNPGPDRYGGMMGPAGAGAGGGESKEPGGGRIGSLYIEEAAVTNRVSSTILYPFQLGFECHDRELGLVMGAMETSAHFFRIRWLAADRRGFRDQALPGGYGSYGMPYAAGGVDDRTFGSAPSDPYGGVGQDPYQMSQGYDPRTGLPYAPRRAMQVRFPSELEEKLLTVHILVEVVSRLPEVPEPEGERMADPSGFDMLRF